MASSSSGKQTPMVRNGGVPANYVPYPPALVRYEDVVINPRLFMDTLEKLHSTLGTKFMIPIIGGKDLDLHRLFVEVTSRGGIEKIMRERRWKEVTTVFNFPSTATNASFVLRKYYKSLLHHFEQIYFFKALGWNSSTDSLRNGSYPPVVPQVSSEEQPRMSEFSPGATSTTETGSQVTGVIDGKFESGYLVSVTIGSEKLKGVLYSASQEPSQTAPCHLSMQQVQNVSTTSKNTTSPAVRRRRRKKSEMKKRDPAHPKPNRSGYNFFFAEQHAKLKPLYAGKDREISRMIGELWTNMKEPDKLVYQDKAAKDKERYITEMESYKERLRTGQIVSEAVPIQQPSLELNFNIAGPSEGTEDVGEGSPQTPDCEISSKSSMMRDFETKIAYHDTEWETSAGIEIGSEHVAKEDKLLDEEGSDSVEDVDSLKVTTPCAEVCKVENTKVNRNEDAEVKNVCSERNEDTKMSEDTPCTPCAEVCKVENSKVNRNEDAEVKNVCSERNEDTKMSEEKKGESEKRHKVEEVENKHRSIAIDEKEPANIEKDDVVDNMGENKRRLMSFEEGLTTSDKRHKPEDEI